MELRFISHLVYDLASGVYVGWAHLPKRYGDSVYLHKPGKPGTIYISYRVQNYQNPEWAAELLKMFLVADMSRIATTSRWALIGKFKRYARIDDAYKMFGDPAEIFKQPVLPPPEENRRIGLSREDTTPSWFSPQFVT